MTVTLTARAALLDMDGTLVDSTAVVERLWLEWSRAHGLDTERVLATVHGRQGHESMSVLLPERPHEINLRENQAMLEREYEQLDGVREVAGAAALLAALEPFPHAVVTSADQRLLTVRMAAAGLALPEVLVTAEHVSRSKPDPEGFLRAAALLGVPAADCLVFEDSAAGVAAGLAAGMTVIGVGEHAADHGPTASVRDLTEVEVTAEPAGFTATIAED